MTTSKVVFTDPRRESLKVRSSLHSTVNLSVTLFTTVGPDEFWGTHTREVEVPVRFNLDGREGGPRDVGEGRVGRYRSERGRFNIRTNGNFCVWVITVEDT